CAYAQGFQLMREAQKEYKWKLNFAEIAAIWRGGCIIRARFLQKITDAYTRDSELVNLLLDPYFNDQIKKAQANWRKIVALAASNGIAAPAFMSALAYYDGYRSPRLPANLLQAQRDYFGAHTYERTDQPRGHFVPKAGGCTPGAKIEKLPSKYKAVQRWNANKKLGQAVAFEAMDTCMKLADEFGVGVVAVDNAFHYLWGGGYVIDAAKKGYIA